MKKNNTTRKQLFVVIKKTRSFAKKTEITTHSRQNTATTSGTASSAPSAGLDNIRLPAPQASQPGAPASAASQPTPPAAPPAATVPPLPKFNKPHAETTAAPSAPPAQPSTASAPQPSLPSPAPAPVAAASTAEPEAAQEPTTPPFAPDYAAVGNQLSKLMSGMAAPLSRLAGNLHGFTAQSLLKPAQSVTPKESKAIVPASNPTESISLPTAPAQKASTPISSGKTGTVQRALATGAAYKQGNIEGLDDAHTRALVASTAATESAGGKLDIRNSAGYIGRYQAGASWLAEAGLIAGGANAVIAAMKADGFTNEYKWGKSGGMTRFLKNKNNWKNGLDYEKYLSSAEAQDTAFKTNSDKAYKQLVKEGTITSKMSQDEIAGILKARHIGGLGGARKAAKGIEGAMDANGTSALKYKNDLAAGNVFIKNYQSVTGNADKKITESGPINKTVQPATPASINVQQRAQSGKIITKKENHQKTESIKSNSENTPQNNKKRITVSMLRKVWKDRKAVSDDRLKEVANELNANLEKSHLNTEERLSHFIAQMYQETGGSLSFTENLNYKPEALISNFGYYKKNSSEALLDGRSSSHMANQESIANKVYGYRLGNNLPDDGSRYRGRGMVHLTGKNNYKDFTLYHKETWGDDTDFEKKPELISSDVRYAVRAALYFWDKNKLYKIADGGLNDSTTNAITKVINEKTDSYGERRKNLEKIANEKAFKDAF